MNGDSSRTAQYSRDRSIPEEILELRSVYIDYLKREIDTFRSLLSQRDLEGIRELGHRLKGSGGSYGFPHISELGETMQCLKDHTEWDEVENKFHELEKMSEQIADGL